MGERGVGSEDKAVTLIFLQKSPEVIHKIG